MPPKHMSTPSTSSPILSARYTVPPMPPQIHRKLTIQLTAEGVIVRPKSSVGHGGDVSDVTGGGGVKGFGESEGKKLDGGGNGNGVLVRWGVKGKVERVVLDHDGVGEETVDLGGILGIVRLWDAAYLLIFLPPTKPPSPLFPNHIPNHPAPDEPLDRESPASSHEVYTLSDIHAIPLIPSLAAKAFQRLRGIQAKRMPKKPSSRGLNINWKLPGINIGGPGTVSSEEIQALADPITDSEGDSEDGEDGETEIETDGESVGRPGIGGKSRESLAPEADDDPSSYAGGDGAVTKDAGVDSRKRFSLGWGRFMPKLGKKKVPGQAETEPSGSEGTVSSLVDEDGPLPVDSTTPPSETDNLIPRIDDKPDPATSSSTTSPDPNLAPPPFASNPPQRRDLENKILREIIREYSSGGFFYSFDFDLTHNLQYKRNTLSSRMSSGSILKDLLDRENKSRKTFLDEDGSPTPVGRTTAGLEPSAMSEKETTGMEDDFVEPDIQVPLWRRVDKRFWWNESLLKDFVELGLHSFILPIMQGWVQSGSFSIPIPSNPLDPSVELGAVPVDMVVISRRSRERAGLRYQRRGVDDEGHVANMVETEMIVRAKVESKVSLFSFVQVRGSIPLKWSQSPYSLKPPPVLDQPVDQSYSVANLHFDDLKTRYGPITIVNLSEQTGKEAAVTNGYKQLIDSLGRKDVTYKDFDFHAKCHGMKWENISELVEELGFGTMGYLWTLQGDKLREQTGAFRTNCIDCLDRTNVVQSALARSVLSSMLTQLGLIADPSTSSIESVFNDVWANNGDMLSFCYAHTSALKGDFVRTGKRDFSGMLHDGVSSISRMFYGAVSDFFAQAVISFMLGHRNLGVFSEFLETLQSSDSSSLIKLSRIRLAAVDTCSARVLSDGEVRIAGWTLLSPEERNVKLSPKLEEKVLLLTKVAIYVVSFNYSLEKVVGFTRIPLASITSLQKGAYILSPLQEASRDPAENAGFVINFSPANESTRYSTYSFRNRLPSSSNPGTPQELAPATFPTSPLDTSEPTTPTTPTAEVHLSTINPESEEFFAFKALPREFSARGASSFGKGRDAESEDEGAEEETGSESCKAVVERIVRRIREQCVKSGVGVIDDFVVEKDVVSLAEAQSSTSILARVDYAFKRFLWL